MRYWAFFAIGMICMFGIGVSLSIPYLTETHIVSNVRSLDRQCSTNSDGMSCKYMVFTDGEVFENTDSALFWKFNSSDVQNSMDIGKKYEFRVYGFRVPMLSMYRNIVSMKEIN